ncbi:MAG TPA: serine/threonine-protein kinase [Gemmatimonadales bacterium]|nr:serine/threonine-protein kinase [Gemmatimonadales bacterium]
MTGTPHARWKQVEALLDEALELSGDDRAAFVARASSGDLELRLEVERLLRATETEAGFLDDAVDAFAAPLLSRLAEVAAPPPGTRLGTYEIVRELGRGGMATVFLARDGKHDREVALKVLHGELAAALGAERFLQEIRISAQLDHPHILTLIDSGESDGFLWYVLPYVRGESLRDKLTRKRRLTVEEAMRIAAQVASALDHAHRHGVIHRDIKPENILLHEGEAILADFGIALAVTEAGGGRLPQDGVTLGTPRYMSPEQRAGGRVLDPRSDVYSLGAVVYEMLAGESPELRIQTMRGANGVPEGVHAAITKALAPLPADRFTTAGEFAAALATAHAVSIAGERRRRVAIAAAIVATLALAVSLWLGARSRTHAGAPVFAVRDPTQVTATGNAMIPALSGDGTRLAYVVTNCTGGSCVHGIDLQEIGGGPPRRVVDGAAALYSISSSPDGRFLLFVGTLGSRYGCYIAPAAGGSPRFLGVPGIGYFPGAFFPGSDSVLLVGATSVRVATLDGVAHDTIRIDRGPADFFAGAWPLSGGRWVLARFAAQNGSAWLIVDRQGRRRDAFRTSREVGASWQRRVARVSSEALWIQVAGGVIRVPIDSRTGTFGHPDTVVTGFRGGFDVTADGEALAFGDGTSQHDLWALSLSDALHGRFPANPRFSSTSSIETALSPDGSRFLLRRLVASTAGERVAFAVVPLAGGGEVVHMPPGEVNRNLFGWTPDGTSFWYVERDRGAWRFVTADSRTGTRVGAVAVSDATVRDADPLSGGGWAWIVTATAGLNVQRPGEREPRTLAQPEGDARLFGVLAAPSDARLATWGWNATGDSILVHEISLPEGRATRWATFFGEGVDGIFWLADRSLLIAVAETQGSATVYRIRGAGKIERAGTIPRPVEGFGVTRDGQRVLIRTVESREDIWLARLTRAP